MQKFAEEFGELAQEKRIDPRCHVYLYKKIVKKL